MKKTLVAAVVTITIIVGSVSAILLLRDYPVPPQTLGTVRINIETYIAGQNQPTHPSVVVFSRPWNGAQYWLAYSPYPYGNGEEENPCVAVSNDLLYWECPSGLANPIANNEETGCDELKDPHLLYRDDLDRLEMWYLGRLAEKLGGDGTSLLLMRKHSYDGISWSEYEVMSPTKYLSPTIIWNGTKYQMWSIGYDLWNTAGTFVYQESYDGTNWTEPVSCFVGTNCDNIDIWHGSVMAHDGQYHLSFVDNTDKQEIFYSSSTDGIHFNEPEIIVENNGHWNFLYRPTLVYGDKGVSCLYGVVNHANQWYLSMSSGSDEQHLIGISKEHIASMYQIINDVIDTHSVRYHLKTLYHAIQTYLRIELLALSAIEVLAMFIFSKKLHRNKYIITICSIINLLLSISYIYIRMRPTTYVTQLGAIIGVLLLNAGMTTVLYYIFSSFAEEKHREA